MRIVSRSEWGARYPNGCTSAPLPAAEVWLHHSVTSAANGPAIIREIERIGQSRFGCGISYTWLITLDGAIFEGHSVNRQGTHTGGRNDRSRAICFVGNYEEIRPTGAQLRSAGWLLQHARANGWITAARLAGGHRDLTATACPGRHAYAAIPTINQLAGGGPIEEGDDMANADEIASVLDGYYILRRHNYGDQDTHDLGTAVYDIEDVLGAAFARTGRRLGDLVADMADDLAELKADLAELRGQVSAATSLVSGRSGEVGGDAFGRTVGR